MHELSGTQRPRLQLSDVLHLHKQLVPSIHFLFVGGLHVWMFWYIVLFFFSKEGAYRGGEGPGVLLQTLFFSFPPSKPEIEALQKVAVE